MNTTRNFIITAVCTVSIIFAFGVIASFAGSSATEQGTEKKLIKATYQHKMTA